MEKLELLEKLTTERLLAYYRAERKRRDLYPHHPSYLYLTELDLREWDLHLEEVKKLLDNREHIEKDFTCGGKDVTYKRLKKKADNLRKKHGK